MWRETQLNPSSLEFFAAILTMLQLMNTTLSATYRIVSLAIRIQRSSISHSLFWTVTSQTMCEWAPNKGREGVRVWEQTWETTTGTAREKVREQISRRPRKIEKGRKWQNQWFNVRRCTHSGESCRYASLLVVQYFHFLLLYTSSLLQFWGRDTTFIWSPFVIACCVRGNTVLFKMHFISLQSH